MARIRYEHIEGMFTVSIKMMPSAGRLNVGDLCAIGEDGEEKQFVIQRSCGSDFPMLIEGDIVWLSAKYQTKDDYWLVDKYRAVILEQGSIK